MSYSFKLKNGALAIFDPEHSLLSITTPLGEVQATTLGRAESRLLALLLAAPGVTKSRDEIIDYAWNDRVVASGSLNQAIFSLRNSLCDGRDHDIVMTIPRRGYRFNKLYIVEPPNVQATPPENEQPVLLGEVEGEAQDFLSRDNAPVSPSMAAQSKPAFIINKLYIGYTLTFAMCLATVLHVGVPFNRPDVEVVITQFHNMTLNAVGTSVDEARGLSETLAKQLETTAAANLKGQVWVSQSKSNYTLACIRQDQSTQTYQFNSQHKALPAMVQQCLETAL